MKKDEKYYSFLIPIIHDVRGYDEEGKIGSLARLTWHNLRQENKGIKNIKKLFYKDKINMIDICKQLERKELIMDGKLDELLLELKNMGEIISLDW